MAIYHGMHGYILWDDGLRLVMGFRMIELREVNIAAMEWGRPRFVGAVRITDTVEDIIEGKFDGRT